MARGLVAHGRCYPFDPDIGQTTLNRYMVTALATWRVSMRTVAVDVWSGQKVVAVSWQRVSGKTLPVAQTAFGFGLHDPDIMLEVLAGDCTSMSESDDNDELAGYVYDVEMDNGVERGYRVRCIMMSWFVVEAMA